MKELSRRTFLTGAGAAFTGAAALGLAGYINQPNIALADETADDAEAIEWTDEADVVIVGLGGAGLSAAATMALEDLGSALILEAAPEELSGGNTRVSGQIVFCPDNPEAAIEYQTALNGMYSVPDDIMQTWAEAERQKSTYCCFFESRTD